MRYVDGAFDRARALLGQPVIASLDDDIVAEGRLLSVSDSGEFVLVDDMGFTHYCWPLLDIAGVTNPQVGTAQ